MTAPPGFITAQDLCDAMGPATFLALFDDGNTGSVATVLLQPQTVSVLRRAHARIMSILPRIYSKLPPEVAAGMIAGGDQIPVLLKDAELLFAQAYAYRRAPEYVRTYGAEPNGSLMKEAMDLVESIGNATLEIASTDTPPMTKPGTLMPIMYDGSNRVMTDTITGDDTGGDF